MRGSDQLTRLSILIRIGQALASNLELGPLLETVYAEVSRLFDTTNFFIALHRAGALRNSSSLCSSSTGQRSP